MSAPAVAQIQDVPASEVVPAPAPVAPAPAPVAAYQPPVPQMPSPSASLYVGELDPTVTEAMLFEIFNMIGPVARCVRCRCCWATILITSQHPGLPRRCHPPLSRLRLRQLPERC